MLGCLITYWQATTDVTLVSNSRGVVRRRRSEAVCARVESCRKRVMLLLLLSAIASVSHRCTCKLLGSAQYVSTSWYHSTASRTNYSGIRGILRHKQACVCSPICDELTWLTVRHYHRALIRIAPSESEGFVWRSDEASVNCTSSSSVVSCCSSRTVSEVQLPSTTGAPHSRLWTLDPGRRGQDGLRRRLHHSSAAISGGRGTSWRRCGHSTR